MISDMVVSVNIELPTKGNNIYDKSYGKTHAKFTAHANYSVQDNLKVWLLRSGLTQIEDTDYSDYVVKSVGKIVESISDLRENDTVTIEDLRQGNETTVAAKAARNDVAKLMKGQQVFLSQSQEDSESSENSKRKAPAKIAQKRQIKEESKFQPKIQIKVDSKVFNQDIHTRNERNPDYFYCQKNQDLMNETKANSYKGVKDLKELVSKLNKQFGEDTLGVYWTGQKYVHVACKYIGCVYDHWYNFTEVQGGATNMVWFRCINQSHSLSCHAKGLIKDKDPL